jgi:HNH endonuclease
MSVKANDEKVKKILELIESGKYYVEDGKIFCSKTGKEKTARNGKGYKVISYRENGKKFIVLQHRVLYAYYHGLDSLDPNKTINHIDGNKDNNTKENLEQISVNENVSHAHQNNLLPRGSDKTLAKLDEEKVDHIRFLLAIGMKHRDIAEIFGVSKSTITNINTGKTWTHVTFGEPGRLAQKADELTW